MTELARDYRESNHELVLSFSRYLESCGRSKHTHRAYRQTVDDFVAVFGSRTIVAATRADIHLFLEKLMKAGLTSVSVNRHIHALRAFFKFLRFLTLVTRDPMLQVHDRKVPGRLPRVLTVAEVERLIAATRNPLGRAVIEVLYGTGVRISELCALRLEDIDLASRVVKVVQGKGSKDRYSLFGSYAAKAISEYIAWRKPKTYLFELPPRNGFVKLQSHKLKSPRWYGWLYVNGIQRNFAVGKLQDLPTEEDARKVFEKLAAKIDPGFHSVEGRPYDVRWIRKLIEDLGERAGIGHVHPHMLRRAAACHMLTGGAGIREIQVFLGHSTIHSTQHYTHLTIEDLQKIHERCHPHEQGNRTAEEK